MPLLKEVLTIYFSSNAKSLTVPDIHVVAQYRSIPPNYTWRNFTTSRSLKKTKYCVHGHRVLLENRVIIGISIGISKRFIYASDAS